MIGIEENQCNIYPNWYLGINLIRIKYVYINMHTNYDCNSIHVDFFDISESGKRTRLNFLDLCLKLTEEGTKLSDQQIKDEVNTFLTAVSFLHRLLEYIEFNLFGEFHN